MNLCTFFLLALLLSINNSQNLTQTSQQQSTQTSNQPPLVSNQPLLIPQESKILSGDTLAAQIKPLTQKNKAQLAYQKIKKQALKRNLPKKSFISSPHNYMYLVLNSDTKYIKLQKIEDQLLFQRLFKKNQVVLYIPETILSSIPISHNPLDNTSRLVKLKQQKQIYLIIMNKNQWVKHKVNEQNFIDFGFNYEEVSQISSLMLSLFIDGEEFK